MCRERNRGMVCFSSRRQSIETIVPYRSFDHLAPFANP